MIADSGSQCSFSNCCRSCCRKASRNAFAYAVPGTRASHSRLIWPFHTQGRWTSRPTGRKGHSHACDWASVPVQAAGLTHALTAHLKSSYPTQRELMALTSLAPMETPVVAPFPHLELENPQTVMHSHWHDLPAIDWHGMRPSVVVPGSTALSTFCRGWPPSTMPYFRESG